MLKYERQKKYGKRLFMGLQFILGNSGSGKTTYMYQRVVEEATRNPLKNYLVIVPEQFTMQTQRMLVDLAPGKAIMNIDVLSFKRLAYRVFDDLGIKTEEILEETGKNLVLRKIAIDKQDKLTVFRPNMRKIGYISEIKSLLSELEQYNISPEQLKGYIESGKIQGVLKAKLSDVLTLYEGFQEYMNGKYITAEEILYVLKDVAKDSKLLQGSVLVFDEFTGFTPIQNTLLYELLPLVDNVLISLTIDKNEDFYHSRGMHELFNMSKETILNLIKMANSLEIEVEEPVVMDGSENKRYVNSPELAYMERNLFRRKRVDKRKYIGKNPDEETKDIVVSCLKSPSEELVLAARQINELVQEKGYRYKEIAVVSGDVNLYGSYVEKVFEQYKIPYFLDTTKEILFHPFIEFIRAIINVANSNFSYESVFRFLRCGFCDICEEDIDNLENYIIATGIKGNAAWKKNWSKTPRNKKYYDLENLNELRIQIYDILAPAYEIFKAKGTTVKEHILALYDIIIKLNIEQKLWDKEKEYLEAGLQSKSKEYGQIYEIVMHVLEKYMTLMGDEVIDIKEFGELLDAGFDAAEVATIPPGYDSVTVGDIERTRLNGIKVLFFIGVNDGIIPKSTASGGIISQYERELLKQQDLELAPGAREQAFIQKFYLYLNITKPSDKVYISFSRTDSDGKSIRPSYFINVIKGLFQNLKYVEYENILSQLDLSSKDAAREYLFNGEKNEEWYALAKYFKEDTDKIIEASNLHYSDEPISAIVAKALYGNNMSGSVTRLEKFANCAYAHYLQYGLNIKEREGFELADNEIGIMYHSALCIYSNKLKDSDKTWFNISNADRNSLADESMQEAILGFGNIDKFQTAAQMHKLDRMKEIFSQTIWAITKQIRKGRFVPEKFEVHFSKEDNLKSLTYDFGNNNHLALQGYIDRIDTCKDDGKMYIKIIDYKSRETKFDLLKLYQGTKLQLVVYMNAALEKEALKNRNVIPGGMFYCEIADPTIEPKYELSEEELEREVLLKFKPKGLVNSEEDIYRAMDEDFEKKSDVIPVEVKSDGSLSAKSTAISTEEFEILNNFASAKIYEMGKDIYDGKVSVNPLSDCKYCKYNSICKIDSKIPGYERREEEKLKKEEIMDKMVTETALIDNLKKNSEKGE